jgi:hypothetical protein
LLNLFPNEICTSAPSLRLVQQRCCEFWLGARREEREYPLWSLTALVYKRNEDLVTLFAWPAAGRFLAAKDWSISGFRACTWNAANFNFVAVSTLSDHGLDEFTDQIRDRLK